MSSRLDRWLAGEEGDGFRDEGTIGRGGTSIVRQLYDPVLQRRTALKILTLTGKVEDARERFLDEARVTGQLEHPNIVPVYEYGRDVHGRDFIHMRLIQGPTLLDRLRELRAARLEPENLAECLQVLLKVCDALGFAHSRGILHRDLKPANIIIGEYGQVYLVDWGLALSRDDVRPVPDDTDVDDLMVRGTPRYMAPEQAEGRDDLVDERTDIYGLGGILYAILAGRPPHGGKGPIQALMAAMQGRIRPPEEGVDGRVPAALSRIAMRALSLRKEDRYPDVRSFRDEVEAFLRGSWQLPVRRFAPGEAIVREGEEGDEAYVIASGRCEVCQEGRGVLRELGEGEVFGELAILTDSRRTSTVRALTEVTLRVVHKDALVDGLGLDTWTGAFVRSLAQRFRELERRDR